MPLPIFNNNGSTGNGTAITANGNFLPIVPEDISKRTPSPGVGQASAYMIDLASYHFTGGTTGVGTTVTFQELGADGTWRNLASPVAVTIANSTDANGILNGPFHGLRIVVSGLVGNGIAYAELKGTVRGM